MIHYHFNVQMMMLISFQLTDSGAILSELPSGQMRISYSQEGWLPPTGRASAVLCYMGAKLIAEC